MPKKSSKPVSTKVIKKAVTEVKENPVTEVPVQKNEISRQVTKTATKNSQLIEMIKTAENGISLKRICENLKWQSHTARSAISRLNKNQNLGIVNDKIAGGNRVYKLPKKD